MICFFNFWRKVRCHIGLWIFSSGEIFSPRVHLWGKPNDERNGIFSQLPLRFEFLTNYVHQAAFPRPHSFNLIPSFARLRPEERNKYRSAEGLP